MKLVYTAQNGMLVGHLRNILEAEGIHCFTRNEYLSGGAGELPPTETWPELWVDERDATMAEQLVREFTAEADETPPWRCENCGEENEGQFALCWKCGKPEN